MFEAIIKAKSKAELRLLGKLGDIKGHSVTQDRADFMFRVDAIVSEEDKKRLESEGYTVEIVSDLSSTAEERLKEVSRTNRFSNLDTVLDEQGFALEEKYMNVEEIEAELVNFSKKYPDLVELIELPNKTWEDRTSNAVLLHSGTVLKRPSLMFTGGMHAREWGTSDICMHFVRKLLHSYKNSKPLQYQHKIYSYDQIRKILENVDIIVFPDVNPDGKAYSQENIGKPEEMWRKNRNPNPVPYPNPEEGELHKPGGVDLNRNFDFLWHSGISTINEDGTDNSQSYRGPEPFSEPESRNVKYLLDNYKNIKCFVDIHGHVGQILMSWGEDDTQCFYPDQNYRNSRYNGKRGKRESASVVPDPNVYAEYMHPLDATTLINYGQAMMKGLTAVRNRKYELKPSFGLYPTSGIAQDYAFSQRLPNDENRTRIYAYSIEFGQRTDEGPEGHFHPKYTVMKNIMDDIASALTELCFRLASENSLSKN